MVARKTTKKERCKRAKKYLKNGAEFTKKCRTICLSALRNSITVLSIALGTNEDSPASS